MGWGTPTDTLTEACLRAAFDVLPEAALIVDAAGRVRYANAFAHRLLGEELVIGQGADWSQPEPERSDTEATVRTSFVAPATGLSLRRTCVPLPDVDGLSLIVLTAVATAETAYPVRDPMERLNEVEATAQVGSWSWDIEADVVSWSDELYRIYGLAPQSMPISYGGFLELVHPDDRPQLEQAVQRCYLEGEPYVENHRVILPDGRLRWHQGRGRVVMLDGRPVRMFGTGQDVTITNPQKLYFPDAGITKLDLVRYYLAVADGALRAAGGRPMALKRYVNGIEGQAFYQKRAPENRPEWIETVELKYPSGRSAHEIVLRDAAQLAWVVNLGCVDLHPHAIG